MTDRTPPDSGRTTGGIVEMLQDRIAELEQEVAHTDSLLGKANALARIRAHRIAELEAQLESIGAGGVSVPLMGKPQEIPDLSALTERGAKAWAGVDAQGLRDGVASVAASAPAPSGHIKEPYTVAEIKAKIASNDYSAELLLQHAMLHLDRLAASAGSEPVAWQYRSVRDKGLWFDCTEERAKQRAAHPETWDVRYLYTHPSPPEGMVGGWIASKDQMPPPGVRVFWGDVDSHRVGYDSWAGEDYRWAPSHWMRIPEFPAPPTTSAGSGKGE